MWPKIELFTFIATTVVILSHSTQENEGDLMKFLQPDDIDVGSFRENTSNCARTCLPNAPPKLCYYQFHLENYVVHSEACLNCTGEDCIGLPQCITADGYERGIISVNRRLPGPSIQVCYGDKIVVDVKNGMLARSTTIHWHGIFQKGTQYQDGVPMISQCPVLESTIHRYSFYANQPGTFYWHSHDGTQKIDGIQGSLIIRRPKENEPHAKLYDLDDPSHVIFITDWYHSDSLQHFPGLRNADPSLDATYFLINGRGRYKDLKSGNMSKAPYTKFVVTKGFSYRFRLIGATCTHCFTRFSIEGHRLKIIATDANSINPVEVDYIDVYTGERYDFVLNASEEVKEYRIIAVGMGDPCTDSDIFQLAILHYEGAQKGDPLTGLSVSPDFNFEGVALNPVNSTCSGSGKCVAQLEAIENFNRSILRPEPNVTYTMKFGYYFVSTEEEFERNTFVRYAHPEPSSRNIIFWMNNISDIPPPSPLLSQRGDIPSYVYCKNGSDGVPECKKDLCHCLYIVRVALGSLAQFILIDKSSGGGFNHPFHLHGHAFNVMAMGYLQDIDETNIEEAMKTRNFSSAPVLKDTVAVPSAGYTVIRFMANNPGYWLLHCHFVKHHVVGMSVIVQVGEPSDLPPVPQGFPKCGNYLPLD